MLSGVVVCVCLLPFFFGLKEAIVDSAQVTFQLITVKSQSNKRIESTYWFISLNIISTSYFSMGKWSSQPPVVAVCIAQIRVWKQYDL